MRTIYLAGAIADSEKAITLRKKVEQVFLEHGLKAISPIRNQHLKMGLSKGDSDKLLTMIMSESKEKAMTIPNIHERAKRIVQWDKHDIRMSDALLVILVKESTGTPMEQIYAFDHNKPVVVLDVREKGVYLSPWTVYHSFIITKSIEEAAKYFVAMFDEFNGDFNNEDERSQEDA